MILRQMEFGRLKIDQDLVRTNDRYYMKACKKISRKSGNDQATTNRSRHLFLAGSRLIRPCDANPAGARKRWFSCPLLTCRAVLREIWLTGGNLLGKEIYVRFQAATTGFLTFPGPSTGSTAPVANNVVRRR